MGKKVNYSQGDNLPLYATPEQSLQQQKNLDRQRQYREENERKKLMLKQDLFLQKQQQQTREELLQKMNGGPNKRLSSSNANKRPSGVSSSSNGNSRGEGGRNSSYSNEYQHQQQQHKPIPLTNAHIYSNQQNIPPNMQPHKPQPPPPQSHPQPPPPPRNVSQQYMIPGGLDGQYKQQQPPPQKQMYNYQPEQQQFSQSYQQQQQPIAIQPNYIAQDLSFNSIGSGGTSGNMNHYNNNDNFNHSNPLQPPMPYQNSSLSSPSSSSTLSNNMLKNLSINSQQAPLLSSNSNNSFQPDDPKEVATQLFHKYDVSKSGRLTAHELQQVLQNDDFSKFKISSIDSIINLFGVSRFNSLNLNEFIYMYHKLSKWRDVYIKNDTNGSHTLTTLEFTESVKSMGYKIPIEVVENLFDQFSEFVGGSKCLKFDRFVESVIWLIRLTKVFRQFDIENNGVGIVEYKDFIDISLYLGKFLPR